MKSKKYLLCAAIATFIGLSLTNAFADQEEATATQGHASKPQPSEWGGGTSKDIFNIEGEGQTFTLKCPDGTTQHYNYADNFQSTSKLPQEISDQPSCKEALPHNATSAINAIVSSLQNSSDAMKTGRLCKKSTNDNHAWISGKIGGTYDNTTYQCPFLLRLSVKTT